MAKVERYTRGVVRRRQVADPTDAYAVQAAGATANAVAEVASIGKSLADSHVAAAETTELNDALLRREKEKFTYLEQSRNENLGNPFGFADRLDQEFARQDEEFAKGLSSSRVQQAFLKTSKKKNLSFYQQNTHWSNKRSVQLYGERVEAAAIANNDIAFLSGKNGGEIDDVLGNANATSISVGSFQPNEDVIASANKRMLQGAATSYLKGVSVSDPFLGIDVIDSGKLDGILPAEELEEYRQSLAGQAIKNAQISDPAYAMELIDSGAFRGVISDANMAKYRKSAERSLDDFNTRSQVSDTAKVANVLTRVLDNNVTLAEIDSDVSLSSDQKAMAKGILIGEEDIIQQVVDRSGVRGSEVAEMDSYTFQRMLRNVRDKFNSSERTNQDIAEASSDMNQLMVAAAASREANKKNRGRGITKQDYKDLLSGVQESSDALYQYADDNSPILGAIFGQTAWDSVVDEVESITSDNPTRSELLGYASEIAKAQNIDLFSKASSGDADKIAKPVIDELLKRRARSLGLPSSRPKTKKAIVGGKVELVGASDEAKASVSVNPKNIEFDAPRVGEVIDGCEFVGGDPSRQTCWRKVEE